MNTKETKNKKTELDSYQKKAVEIEQNAVVSAGAGSGKTKVLSERFLHLVQNKHYNVEEILTLTFTKKATVEMSDRIYKVLAENAPEQAANFYKSNIKTLDSYCASVAKMGAHFYGINPNFVQNDEIIDLAKKEALPFILKNRDNPALKLLVGPNDYDQVAEEVFVNPIFKISPIAEPLDFEKAFEYQCTTILNAWNKISKNTDYLISQIVTELNELPEDKKKSSYFDPLKENLIESEYPSMHELKMEEIQNSDYKILEEYSIFIQKIQKTNLQIKDQLIKENISSIRDNFELLVSIVNFVQNYKTIKSLIPLLKEFNEIVNNLKRTTGFLTFTDISNLALNILKNYPEIRKVEKQKYKQIMIDEFQDNNSFQRDMLFLLAEKEDRMEKSIPQVNELYPDKLFFVGDEKQSIYLFRGADVSVFNSLSNDFLQGNLSMPTNYRSSPSLIAAFNTIFGGVQFSSNPDASYSAPSVFFKESDKKTQQIPSYEAVYKNVTYPKDCDKSNLKPPVHFAFFDKNKEQDEIANHVNEEAEAIWIAKKIRSLIENGVNPNDVAILIRSKSQQPVLERILLEYSIPFAAEEITSFFSDGPVNDIYNLLKLITDCEDKIAYENILTSPFVNLSIQEATLILTKGDKPFAKESLSVFDSSIFNSEEIEEIKRRYLNAQKIYLELSELSSEIPLTDLISKIWYDYGYRLETLWNEKVQVYTKYYDNLFEIARLCQEDSKGLNEFIDTIDKYKKEKVEGITVLSEKTYGVQLMTIHKSKGLEFDYVFLCGIQKSPNETKNNQHAFCSPEYGICINTQLKSNLKDTKNKNNYFFKKLEKINNCKESAELKRVIYVAITRAKKEVFITSYNYTFEETKNNKSNEEKLPGTISDVLSPILNFYYNTPDFSPFTFEEINAEPRFTNPSAEKKRSNRKTDLLKFQNELIQNDYYSKAEVIILEEPESIYKSPSVLSFSEQEFENFDKPLENVPFPQINELFTSSFTSTNFGTIAHAYLEAKINGEKPVYSNKEILGLEKNKKGIEVIEQVCNQMAQTYAKSTLGQKAINSKWHKAEYPFKNRIGKYVIKGVIDLVFLDSDGTYIIVDYKTNQEMNPKEYYTQLACYRHSVAQMLNIDDMSKIKCYLYYLRYAKEVDITSECQKINIEEILK